MEEKMAVVSTYLNFKNNAEQAFVFYKSVFGTEFKGPIMRFKDMPQEDDTPPIAKEDENLVLHVTLPIMGGFLLMGSDVPESMRFEVKTGTNVHISIQPDSREEADRLFQELSEGGEVSMPMQDMFWGDYFGSFTDKFGINWMINFPTGQSAT